MIQRKQVSVGHFLTFIIWPFATLVISFVNSKKSWAKNLFWLYCIYFGYTFTYIAHTSDAERYITYFVTLGKIESSLTAFLNFLTKNTGYFDILNPMLSFILSRFTSDPRILYAFYGLIFGYFYSRNIWILYNQIPSKLKWIQVLFFISFCLLIPIWQINNFRFWCASHIFLFGVFSYLIHNKHKYILVALLSPLVHFSFAFPAVFLLLYFSIGNRQRIYFILFLITLFINQINLYVVKEQFNLLPQIFEGRSDMYIYEGAIKDQSSLIMATHWYIQYYNLTLKWISSIFLILIFFTKNKGYGQTRIFNNFYNFSLLFYAFVNIANMVPLGYRFTIVGSVPVFFMLTFIPYLVNTSRIILQFRKLCIPFLIYIIIVSFRFGMDYIGLLPIFGNPISVNLISADSPLISFIK